MASHNSPVHIVTARVRINGPLPPDGPSTENKLLTIEPRGKRPRPGIASVKLCDDNDIAMNNCVGIAVYDRQHKLGVSDLAMLVQGVAEVSLTEDQIETLVWRHNFPNRPCYPLRKLHSVGEGKFVWRCWWNFKPQEEDATEIVTMPGIESSETHFVQTRTFYVSQETNFEDFDAGKPINGNYDNTVLTANNIFHRQDTNQYEQIQEEGDSGLGGIMLWPLTKKAAGKPHSQYAKAATMNLGVATLYLNDEMMQAVKSKMLTTPVIVFPGNRINSGAVEGESRAFVAQVLEVYQRSARFRIVSICGKEFGHNDVRRGFVRREGAGSLRAERGELGSPPPAATAPPALEI